MKGKKILSVFLSLAMMLSLLIFGGTNFTAEELKNLATNPGFEDGTSPWVKWGGYELAEGSEARTGSKSLEAVPNTNSYGGPALFLDEIFDDYGAGDYTITFYAKAKTENMRLRLFINSVWGTAQDITTSSWTVVTHTFTLTETFYPDNPAILITPRDINEFDLGFYMDDISLTKDGVCVTPTAAPTAAPTEAPCELLNLLPDPSFEGDQADILGFYVPWGAAGEINSVARTGSNSLKITADSWTAVRIDLTETMQTYGDGTYTLSFYVRAVDLPNNMYFRFKKDGVDDDPLGWTDGVYSSTDEWIKISGTFDLDGAADYSEILVFIVAHNMAQESNPISELGRNYLLDDISLTKEGVCVTPTPEQNATPTTSPESNDDVQTGDTRMPIILLILVSAAIAIIVNYKRKEA